MLARILDILFPPKCASCGYVIEGGAFCATCSISLWAVAPPWCVRCGIPFAGGVDHVCSRCMVRKPPFERARSRYRYGSELGAAIARFKYGRHLEMARTLGPLLGPLPRCDLVVPVPLHRKRLRSREFNQALELCRAAWPGAPIDPLALRRVRDTPPQAGLDMRRRRENVRGVFAATPARVSGHEVLLVDDVLTTGATVESCSKALRRAGAGSVVVLTLARAVP